MSFRLQTAVDELTRTFSAANILNKDFDRDSVKLHLTLMNTKFRLKKESTGVGPADSARVRGRLKFDASSILNVSV